MRKLNDLQAFYDALIPVQVKEGGSYTAVDRLRDFREVFFSTDQGQRVLGLIMNECEGLPVTLNQIGDHSYLAFRHGKREVGLRIVQWMNALPPDVKIERMEDDG